MDSTSEESEAETLSYENSLVGQAIVRLYTQINRQQPEEDFKEDVAIWTDNRTRPDTIEPDGLRILYRLIYRADGSDDAIEEFVEDIEYMMDRMEREEGLQSLKEEEWKSEQLERNLQLQDDKTAERQAKEEANARKLADEEANKKRRAEEEANVKRRAEAEANVKRRAEEEANMKRRAEEEANVTRRVEEEAIKKR